MANDRIECAAVGETPTVHDDLREVLSALDTISSYLDAVFQVLTGDDGIPCEAWPDTLSEKASHARNLAQRSAVRLERLVQAVGT